MEMVVDAVRKSQGVRAVRVLAAAIADLVLDVVLLVPNLRRVVMEASNLRRQVRYDVAVMHNAVADVRPQARVVCSCERGITDAGLAKGVLGGNVIPLVLARDKGELSSEQRSGNSYGERTLMSTAANTAMAAPREWPVTRTLVGCSRSKASRAVLRREVYDSQKPSCTSQPSHSG